MLQSLDVLKSLFLLALQISAHPDPSQSSNTERKDTKLEEQSLRPQIPIHYNSVFPHVWPILIVMTATVVKTGWLSYRNFSVISEICGVFTSKYGTV